MRLSILILSQKEVSSEIQQKISLFDRQKIYYLIDNTLSENEIKLFRSYYHYSEGENLISIKLLFNYSF